MQLGDARSEYIGRRKRRRWPHTEYFTQKRECQEIRLPATTLNHLGLCGMPCSGPSGRDRSDGVRSGNRDHNMACNLHVLPFGAARYVKER